MSPERKPAKKRHPLRRAVATTAALGVIATGAYASYEALTGKFMPKTSTTDRVYDALTNVQLSGETVFVKGTGQGSAQTTERVEIAGHEVPFGDRRKTTVTAEVDVTGGIGLNDAAKAVSLALVPDSTSPSGVRINATVDPDEFALELQEPQVKNNPDGSDGAQIGKRVVTVFTGDAEIAARYQETGAKAKDNLKGNAAPVLGKVLPFGVAEAVRDEMQRAGALLEATGKQDGANTLKSLAQAPMTVTVLRPDSEAGALLFPEAAIEDAPPSGIVVTAETMGAVTAIQSDQTVKIVFSNSTNAA